MKFILRMAYREIRASWHRLLFFFLCIAIGVGSIVSLRSIVQNVRASVSAQAQALMTADVQISSGSGFNKEATAVLEKYYRSPNVLDHSNSIEMPTMVSAVNAKTAPKQVELRGVQASFPFYGEMVLSGGQRYDFSLLKDRGVVVRPALLQQLGVNIGDKVKIGKLEFTIRGVVEQEPGNTLNAFSFGPRVFAAYDDVIAAGLTGFGSRARYRIQLKTKPGQAEAVTKQIKDELKAQPMISVRSYRDAENRVAESFTQVENFLSLIGLIILVLGGIGISSVTRVFIQQKMKTVAVLKCLGGRNARVLGTYLMQVMTLGVIGSAMGVLISKVVMILLPRYLADKIPPGIEIALTWPAIAQGFGIGILIALLFAALPLLEIRNIKPILVLRATDLVKSRRWFDPVKIGAGAVVIAGLVALAAWQAGSLKIGAIFLAGLAATAFLLNLAGTLLIRFVKQLRHVNSFVLRQGINSLYRPGNQTKVILLAVGLGAFFIISVRLLQTNLLDEFSLNLSANAPDLYLIDIQPSQREAINEMITKELGTKPELIPTLRARIAEINGQAVNSTADDKEKDGKQNQNREPNQARNRDQNRGQNRDQNRGMLMRDYVCTYRGHVDPHEEVIAGTFWDSSPSTQPEISIEEIVQKELNLNLGDAMTFDFAGKRITAKVTSVRRVDWKNARIGFFIVFRPGPLDALPQQMLISAVKAPPPGPARVQFQRNLLERFGNISVIDVRDILEAASKVIDTVSTAVTFVGGFVFLSGLLILIGSIAMTKYHRLYESAILKTLGARRKLIVLITLIEYGVLGLLAGVIGSAAAIILSWSVSKYALEIGWSFVPSINVIGVALTLLLVTVIGVISSWDVMIKKPLGILRAE
ncbi:MAG TPA: FtsX-like permease family protein [Blastocatellia bacterium]|nr:FtsX-like permease family protein [Blastocatellia bacterium]